MTSDKKSPSATEEQRTFQHLDPNLASEQDAAVLGNFDLILLHHIL